VSSRGWSERFEIRRWLMVEATSRIHGEGGVEKAVTAACARSVGGGVHTIIAIGRRQRIRSDMIALHYDGKCLNYPSE
jgi:hypothetical protein